MIYSNFLGNSPSWFKATILGMVFVVNPILLMFFPKEILGWGILFEFIFTLMMALKCYPLQSGGLVALTALVLGLTTPEHVLNEIIANIEVILLLIFMVAAVYFMKDLLMFIFMKLFIKVKSKIILVFLVLFIAAFLSAFLDALTVTAILIAVSKGFYEIYHGIQSDPHVDYDDNNTKDNIQLSGDSLEKFRSFLRSIVMHGVIGTALGGVFTLVGEPQNVIIGEKLDWNFIEFASKMAPVAIPVLLSGLFLSIILEKFRFFGYGEVIPDDVKTILQKHNNEEDKKRTRKEKYALCVQAIGSILLIFALATHVAPVGIIGLFLLILLTVFMGKIDEHTIGHAFEESLPFTALLCVFFVIVAMIHDLHLFTPVVEYVLLLDEAYQPTAFYVANGILSMISDNVFVATVYINEVKEAFDSGRITRDQYENLAIAINTGTNLPSIATPNGQAALLFLLTSALAPLIRLSYARMMYMALPYTIIVGGVGLLMVYFFV